uniref:Uncharacterized protein n=1 Tax=Cacopsylla melanoneura TaxID=428564 RepID=A0A8D8Z4P5_9HEMI
MSTITTFVSLILNAHFRSFIVIFTSIIFGIVLWIYDTDVLWIFGIVLGPLFILTSIIFGIVLCIYDTDVLWVFGIVLGLLFILSCIITSLIVRLRFCIIVS